MKILAIETSTEACSAAVLQNQSCISKYELAPRRHAELILPMIDELLLEAGVKLKEMDCLAFGCGPGAFTGVRIATGVIQGLAFSCDLPVVSISSLAALAQGTNEYDSHIITAIDARMDEVYYATYAFNEAHFVQLVGDESVSKPAEIIFPVADSYYGVGTGWSRYTEDLTRSLGSQLTGFDGHQYPQAVSVARLAAQEFSAGNTLTAEAVRPNYIRHNIIS